MSRFQDADLDKLPPLPLDTLSFDAIREARGAELARRLIEAGWEFDVEDLETDPLVIAVARAGGTRELLAIARANDAVSSVMLATSWGAYLDHLGASQTPAVYRKPLVAEPRPYAAAPQDWEDDTPFRRRIQLAPEMLSAAGPEGAYFGYAVATPGVKTVGVWAPMSFGGTRATPFTPLGEVHVPVVAAAGDGTASAALCAAVQGELRAKDRRPIADFVTAMPATILRYRIEAVLEIGFGVDADFIERTARARLERQAARQHRPGAAQLVEQVKAAAYVTGPDGAILVERVRLIAPAADVNAGPPTPAVPTPAYSAPYCTEIVIRTEVVDV